MSDFKKLSEPWQYRKLSEETQFAFCLAAGVPMETESRMKGNAVIVTMRTMNPCAVVEVEPGKFTVFTNPNIPAK